MRGCVFRQRTFPERNARTMREQGDEMECIIQYASVSPAPCRGGVAAGPAARIGAPPKTQVSRCGLLLAEAVEAHDFRALA
jgi:hypothetical protein